MDPLQHHLGIAVDASSSAVLLTAAGGRITHANAGAGRLLGCGPDKLLGHGLAERLPGLLADPALAAALARPAEWFKTRRVLRRDVRVLAPTGQPMWLHATLRPVAGEAQRAGQCLVMLADITLPKAREVLQTLMLEALALERSVEDTMALLGQEVGRLAPGMAIAMRPTLAEGTGTLPNPPPDAPACWPRRITNKDGRMLGTLLVQTPGRPTALHRHLVRICQHLCGLLLERECTRQRMHRLAYHDALTGLPNRLLLLSHLQRLLHEARRTQTPLALAFIDLDGFKLINDTEGHAVGDALLCALARRFEATARKSDIVGRLGGDEFVVVLPQCDAAQARTSVQRLLDAATQPLRLGPLTLMPRASIGIALHPQDGDDADTLLRHADQAMYAAKREGGQGLRFFSEVPPPD